MQETKEIDRKPRGLFLVLLFGFFYLNVRLVIECVLKYVHTGPYTVPAFRDIPLLIVIFNILTAITFILAVSSICLALSGHASSIRGLRRTAAYYFLLVFLLPFMRRTVMWGMALFLVLFYSYLLFSPNLRRCYPKNKRKPSAVGKAALVAIVLFWASILMTAYHMSTVSERSIPYDINTVSLNGNEDTNGYCTFEFPEGWILDTLAEDDEGFPISYYHSTDSSLAWVHSCTLLEKNRASHNDMVYSMAPVDEKELSGPTNVIDTLMHKCPSFYSEYALKNGAGEWRVATMFDYRSNKATSIAILSRKDIQGSADELFSILNSVSFELDGELLEE